MKFGHAKHLIRLSSIALFLSSLALGGACTNGSCQPGILFLLLGGLVWFTGLANVAWLANPTLVYAWVMLEQKDLKSGTIASLLALGLTSLPLFASEVIDNEGGVPTNLEGFEIGYWLWLSSTIVMLIGNLYLIASKSRKA